MAKNLYERRLERAAKPRSAPTTEELRAIVVKRAREFVEELAKTDDWNDTCEAKADLLAMAVMNFDRRFPNKPSGEQSK